MRRRILAVLLAAVFLLPTQTATVGAADRVDRPTGRLAPRTGALFGSYIKPRNWDRDSVKAAIRRRERKFGRTQDVSHWLYDWSKNGTWPNWRERWHVRKGRIPMVSWGGTKTRAINRGTHDRAIRRQANKVADFGKPIFLRWFWEMDANTSARRVGTPKRFRRAWRRIHTIFQDRGAHNAVWVWCPTAWGFANGEAPAFYPGNAYVDWVCADGFNWAPGRKGEKWRSFEAIYTPFYRWAMKRSKPLMAGTYGVQEHLRRPGRKAMWFDNARQALKTTMKGFAGVFYFDSKRLYDWRVNTSRSAYRAYIRIARDPWFNVGPG